MTQIINPMNVPSMEIKNKFLETIERICSISNNLILDVI